MVGPYTTVGDRRAGRIVVGEWCDFIIIISNINTPAFGFAQR